MTKSNLPSCVYVVSHLREPSCSPDTRVLAAFLSLSDARAVYLALPPILKPTLLVAPLCAPYSALSRLSRYFDTPASDE